ncbi:MAG: NADH-quinone oxidoreductase subunit C [Thermonemataceae bacterium]|nr:NADH-quinone oxidoreductase subunit C [Thermonemataceae bacterium]
MTFEEINQLLIEKFGNDKITPQVPNTILIDIDILVAVAKFLYENPKTYFDFLSCITGIDNGLSQNTMEVIYNLYSIPYQHSLMLKVIVERNTETLPKVPTLCHIWRAADWHERETYDLLGIEFVGHPDLRRILMPADWKGYPLRKDYQEPESYHQIPTK